MLRAVALMLLATLAAQDTPEPAPKRVRFEWSLRKGHLLRYEVTLHATSDFARLDVDQTVLLGLQLRPTEEGQNGTVTADLYCDRVKITMAGVQEVQYDSDSDDELPEDSVARTLADLKGKTITMKMDRRGHVLQVDGADEIGRNAAKKDRKRSMLSGVLLDLLTNERMKGLLQQSLPSLPEKPLAEGDEWDFEGHEQAPVLGRLKVEGTTKLRKIREAKKEAVLVQNLKLRPDPKADDPNPLGFLLKTGDGAGDTELVWNYGKGRIQSARSNTHIKLHSAGQEFTIRMKVSTRLAPRPREY